MTIASTRCQASEAIPWAVFRPEFVTPTQPVPFAGSYPSGRGATRWSWRRPLPDRERDSRVRETEKLSAPGLHTVTAEARGAAGNLGSSAPVGVTVDNSAPPPALITIDAMVNARGSGTLVSPGLTTTTLDDVLIAFVSYDGPNSPGSQSSTVTGGGVIWMLEKRSNTQAGDSEIWSAQTTGTLSGAVVTATPLANGYHGMLTVIAFANAAGTGVAGASGARIGAPDITLSGVEPGSWVFAADN